MELNPTTVAIEIQHQQWLSDIQACNARPKGMTVDEWCRQHGIKKNTYYWRMKALRKACLQEMQNVPEKSFPARVPDTPSFVELTPPVSATAGTECVTLKLGSACVEIPETISDDFLRRILEAASHA